MIVTATDSAEAAGAVRRVGGEVTSDLWLIKAVAARVPADRLRELSTARGVTSIVANRGVQTADGGWVSQGRIRKNDYSLGSTQAAQASFLPDGAFVSVTESGKMTIVNPDGTQRAVVYLSGGAFRNRPVIGADSTIYVTSEYKIYALTPTGATVWRYSLPSGRIFYAGATLAPDGDLYAADGSGTLYAIEARRGRARWTFNASPVSPVRGAPVVGSDGTPFYATEGGKVYAINPTNGSKRWEYSAGKKLTYSPLLANGAVIVTSRDDKAVRVLSAASGSLIYAFNPSVAPSGQPAVAADGSVYLASEDGKLIALNANGSQRFLFSAASGAFKTSPVLAADGRTVYAAVESNVLYAVDTATGLARWSYRTLGAIKASPTVDAEGAIYIGSEGKDLVRLTPDGTVAAAFDLSQAINQPAATAPNGDAVVRVGSSSLVTTGKLPETWDGRPDVEATSDSMVWKLAYPVNVDVGADQLHRSSLSNGQLNRGDGVTVAVVDSGMYVAESNKLQLQSVLQELFLGQADFVDTRCSGGGSQGNGYCLTNYQHSRDLYGHGSHVAGIIWNNYKDFGTNVALGVAPKAKILSVRVLNNDGLGTYESVINGIQWVVQNRAQYNVRVMNLSLSALATTPYFVDPINRAVEGAWANGIVVVAAAGNAGPRAGTITVPGNDPYVITVGALDGARTAGFWAGDKLPVWSSTGPTLDGFAKPDVLAPGTQIVSFLYNHAGR